VSTLLSDLGYSLQANKKVLEGAEHPDINRRTKAFMRFQHPIVSINYKKNMN
jgi:hypothetical protein